MQEESTTKVGDLTPASKKVDVIVKVLSLGDRKTIDSKFGGSRDLVEAVVGDETGTVTLTLWEDQIDRVALDEVLAINNGYVTLVRGHMRLNVGKYGTMDKSEEDIPEVNTSVDMSAQEFERERRDFGRGRRSGSDFGEKRSYGRGRQDREGRRRGQRGRRY